MVPTMAVRGRPKKIQEPVMVHLRFPADVVAELDAWVEEMRASFPGLGGISRTDLVRDIVLRALADRKKPGRRK